MAPLRVLVAACLLLVGAMAGRPQSLPKVAPKQSRVMMSFFTPTVGVWVPPPLPDQREPVDRRKEAEAAAAEVQAQQESSGDESESNSDSNRRERSGSSGSEGSEDEGRLPPVRPENKPERRDTEQAALVSTTTQCRTRKNPYPAYPPP